MFTASVSAPRLQVFMYTYAYGNHCIWHLISAALSGFYASLRHSN